METSAPDGTVLVQRADDGNILFMTPDLQNRSVACFVEHPTPAIRHELFRVARNLLEVALLRTEFVPLHASAAVTDAGAIMFVGDKFAGKTTSMVNLVTRGAAFLANDKVFLFHQQGKLWATALPVAAALRRGTIDSFAVLHPLLLDIGSAHPENKEEFGEITRIMCKPRRMMELMGAQIESCAPLRAVFFPAFDAALDTPTFLTGSEDSLLANLRRHTLPTLFPNQPYWSSWVPGYAPDRTLAKLFEGRPFMLRKIVSGEIVQGRNTNRMVHDEILRITRTSSGDSFSGMARQG